MNRKGFTLIELVVVVAIVAIIFALTFGGCSGCQKAPVPPVSSSGVQKVAVKVDVGSDGLTAEQRNIKAKYDVDNKPGAIKHLYIVSAYSGDCILYSTVKGKVTSSGKRLSPTTVAAGQSGAYEYGIPVNIGGQTFYTGEVCQDDGTYGHSIPYLLWIDARDIFHQHYISGGQIVHISEQPMMWPKIILNLETTAVK